MNATHCARCGALLDGPGGRCSRSCDLFAAARPTATPSLSTLSEEAPPLAGTDLAALEEYERAGVTLCREWNGTRYGILNGGWAHERLRRMIARARSGGNEGSDTPTPADELEVDALLEEFQRACVAVVLGGDSRLSETTKARAIARNALRAKLLRPACTSRNPSPPGM